MILVAVILLLTSLCYLKIQTRSAWILNSSFHVLTATSISGVVQTRKVEDGSEDSKKAPFIVIIVTVYRVDRTQYRGRSRNDSQ